MHDPEDYSEHALIQLIKGCQTRERIHKLCTDVGVAGSEDTPLVTRVENLVTMLHDANRRLREMQEKAKPQTIARGIVLDV